MKAHRRPTAAEIAAAQDRKVADIIGPRLRILFCGINPGLYSAAIGHHFGRPGNRFWPVLYRAGLVPRLLTAWEDRELLEYGYGITNLAKRATAKADELSTAELTEGAPRLEAKVRRYRPACVAVVGITAYRAAFGRPKAILGQQPDQIGETMLWVLPNPSGLNAHHSVADLTRLFDKLRRALLSLRQR